jgi:hypothetical protein
VIIIIPSCAFLQHLLLCCTKWLPGLKKKNPIWLTEVKLLAGFPAKFTGDQ